MQQGSLSSVGAGTLAVSRKYADDHHWRVGSTVATTFGDGATEQLHVAAVYEDRSLFGDLLVPNPTWVAHATQPSDLGVFIGLAPGVGIERGRDAVEAVATRYAAPTVQDRDEYIAPIGSQVDQLLAIVYLFLALAIVIAFMGIANTLSLAVHERTRELGLLRAVGQTRAQLRSVVCSCVVRRGTTPASDAETGGGGRRGVRRASTRTSSARRAGPRRRPGGSEGSTSR